MPPDQQPSNPSTDDTIVIGILTIFAAAVSVLMVIWCGAATAALVTGHPVPPFAVGQAWAAVTGPGDPSAAWGTSLPSVAVVWSITGAYLLLLATGGGWAWRTWRRRGGRGDRPHRTLQRLPGTATASEIQAVAGRKAVMARAKRLRPSLSNPSPTDIGHQLGRARGVAVWSSVEDSRLILGPPRSGKGLNLIIPMILDAPGAVVTTSTRPDNLTATLQARRSSGGPIAVFDPQQLAPGISGGLRWSPVRGCEDPQTAMIRARGLAAGSGIGGGGVENGDFWKGQTEAVLRGMLHAAAIGGRGAGDLYRWSLDPTTAIQAARILQDSPRAANGWADALESAATADERTRDSIWLGVRQALAALADPRVLDAVSPRPGEQFDPQAFIRDSGTLYLLGTAAGAGNAGALVSALIEDMVEAARKLAAASPSARLDPPMNLILDEIGNLTPLESLPVLMSEGGGSGIVTTAVFQSLAQMRAGWSDNTANSIWESAIAKIILGGSTATRDLQDLVTLIGDRDEETVSISRSYGERDGRSRQVSYRRVPIIDTSLLRTLPFGTAVLMLRAAPPIVLDLQAWTNRPDGKAVSADQSATEKAIADAFANAGIEPPSPTGDSHETTPRAGSR